MAIKINSTTVIDDNRNISSVGVATIGSGSSITRINGNTGIVNVGTGITIEGIPGNISIAGTLTAAGFNIPTNVVSFSPSNNTTNQAVNLQSIVFTFDQVIGIATTGSIELKKGSPTSVGFQTFFVNNIEKTNNYSITIRPSSLLPYGTSVYAVIPKNLIQGTGGFLGINTLGGKDYVFNTVNTLSISQFSPGVGSTNVGVGTTITLTFNSAPSRGIGTITLQTSSGTIIEQFNAESSNRISISGNNYIIDPTLDLPGDTTYTLIIPNNAIIPYEGLNVGITSYSFTTGFGLGSAFGGGVLICQSGGTRWVIAPNTADISASWYGRSSATTCAQQVSGCTGWFIPTRSQLQNPGSTCKQYWSCCNTKYWSNEGLANNTAYAVCIQNNAIIDSYKYSAYRVRAFRCVSY